MTLGRSSSAEIGSDSNLARLTASCGALTRLWLSVPPTSAVHITDDIDGRASCSKSWIGYRT